MAGLIGKLETAEPVEATSDEDEKDDTIPLGLSERSQSRTW